MTVGAPVYFGICDSVTVPQVRNHQRSAGRPPIGTLGIIQAAGERRERGFSRYAAGNASPGRGASVCLCGHKDEGSAVIDVSGTKTRTVFNRTRPGMSR